MMTTVQVVITLVYFRLYMNLFFSNDVRRCNSHDPDLACTVLYPAIVSMYPTYR